MTRCPQRGVAWNWQQHRLDCPTKIYLNKKQGKSFLVLYYLFLNTIRPTKHYKQLIGAIIALELGCDTPSCILDCGNDRLKWLWCPLSTYRALGRFVCWRGDQSSIETIILLYFVFPYGFSFFSVQRQSCASLDSDFMHCCQLLLLWTSNTSPSFFVEGIKRLDRAKVELAKFVVRLLSGLVRPQHRLIVCLAAPASVSHHDCCLLESIERSPVVIKVS